MPAVSRCRTLALKMEAKKNENDHTLSTELVLARQKEQQAVRLARDVKTLVQWLNHDVFALAGLDLAQRRILVDFIVAELRQREHLDSARIRPVRRALENQRDDVLAFAGVLDAKLADIAHGCSVLLVLVCDACLLQRKSSLSSAYWQRWNQSITSSPTNSMVSSMSSSRR